MSTARDPTRTIQHGMQTWAIKLGDKTDMKPIWAIMQEVILDGAQCLSSGMAFV